MKITTGGTGVISSQSSMVASTLGGGGGIGGGSGGVTPLNYEYTWAVTFANMGSLSPGVRPTAANYDSITYGSDGIRIVKNASAAGVDTQLAVIETEIDSAYHSYGSDGNQIPAAAIPDIHDGSFGAATNQSNAIGHGGRYINIVATFNSFTMTDTPVYAVALDVITSTTLLMNKMQNTGGPITHYNGSSGSLSVQADYDTIISGGGHTVLTFDLATVPTFCFGDLSDDITRFTIRPVFTKKVNWDITFHGIILSDSVISNSDVTLPIHITSPTIGDGPS